VDDVDDMQIHSAELKQKNTGPVIDSSNQAEPDSNNQAESEGVEKRRVIPMVMIRELHDGHECQCAKCDSTEGKEHKKEVLTAECYEDFKLCYKGQFEAEVRAEASKDIRAIAENEAKTKKMTDGIRKIAVL